MTYASCIDLEILVKEMMDYDIPSDLQWKEIVRYLFMDIIKETPKKHERAIDFQRNMRYRYYR
jgi:hypothetical protein